MRLYLINPPSYEGFEKTLESGYFPHLGIKAIESYLKLKIDKKELPRDLQIKVLDGEVLDYSCIKDQVDLTEEGEIYVGFYTAVNNYKTTVSLSKYLKRKRKGIVVIYGGHWATHLTEQILRTNPYVDAIVRGDGEEALYKILKGDSWKDINGVCFLNEEKQFVKKPITFVKISDLPTPFLFTENLDSYFKNQRENQLRTTNTYFSKESCDRHCSFCSIWGLKNNKRSPEQAWKESLELRSKLGVKCILDVQNNIDPSWLREFASLANKYNPDQEIRFKFYVSTDRVSQEFIEDFKKADGERLFIGFESNDRDVLRHAGKKTSPEDNKRALELIKKNNLFLDAAFVLGLPYETSASLERTIDFIKECIEYKSLSLLLCSILVPLPGSPIWTKYIERIPELKNRYIKDNNSFILPIWSTNSLEKDFIEQCPDIKVTYPDLNKALDGIRDLRPEVLCSFAELKEN